MRETVIIFRVSPDERQLIQKRAADAGMGVSQWIRFASQCAALSATVDPRAAKLLRYRDRAARRDAANARREAPRDGAGSDGAA